MSDFPTVSRGPNRVGYMQSLLQDPTLISDFENGAQITRSRYENVALKFEFILSYLTSADKILLEDFQQEVSYRAGSFNWTSPFGITYIVRFNQILSFKQERANDHWNVAVKIAEIRPNTSEQIS